MPFSFTICDCSPLVVDNEFEIDDEDLLAEYVGRVVLGHYFHVKNIINELSSEAPITDNEQIDIAISRLSKDGKSQVDIEKRDGWIFQIISWLALLTLKQGEDFYCQQPHDAPAQHGLDGLSIELNEDKTIKEITISEDKCTTNHRILIPKVWKEFGEFEKGLHNNKIITRISALLEHLDQGALLASVQNDICTQDLWRYRLGINRTDTYEEKRKRKKLYKGFDKCVTGNTPHRRFGSTINRADIRNWMENFSLKIIEYLNSQKSA